MQARQILVATGGVLAYLVEQLLGLTNSILAALSQTT